MSRLQRLEQAETEDLLIFGYSCKLFRDDEKAQTIDEGQHLIPWMGNDSLKIDRYDARGTLFDLSGVEAPIGGFDMYFELTESERNVEMACDEERYRSLLTNDDEEKLYMEEEGKRKDDDKAYGQVSYNYEEIKAKVVKEEVEVDDDRPFVASPFLDIPVNMTLPTSMKHNAVIEKTAMFISSQGGQMEIILKAKQNGNPMFDFLTFGNPLHAYYRLVLGYIKSGRYVPNAAPEPTSEPEKPCDAGSVLPPRLGNVEDSNAYSDLLLKLKQKAQALKLEQQKKLAEEQLQKEKEALRKKQEAERLERLRKAAERIAEKANVPPDVEIDISKMASYAAKNGRAFETVIKNKKNAKFAFLEPSHAFHEFYLNKIMSYQELAAEENSTKPPAKTSKEVSSSNSQKITPISFAIKPKEIPTIREKSALPVEDNSDSEEHFEGLVEYDMIEGGSIAASMVDKSLQLERKRKASAFLKSLNVPECGEGYSDSAVDKKLRTASIDEDTEFY